MPGLNICFSTTPIATEHRKRLQRAAQLSCFEDRLRVADLYANANVYCSFAEYEHYPRVLHETEDFLSFVEGSIYNLARDKLKSLLDELATAIFTESTDCKKRLVETLSTASGEFILLFIEKKTGALAVVSDILGQLPLYYSRTENGIYISRDPKFILAATGARDFDRTAIMQYLHCGIILGERTFFRGISTVPQAAVIRCLPGHQDSPVEVLHCWDFSDVGKSDVPLQNAAIELKTVFTKGLRDRQNSHPDLMPLLALSGGLDSRAALAALTATVDQAETYTCLNSTKVNLADYDLGRRLAEHLGARWQGFELGGATPQKLLEIIYNQCGATSSVMAHGYGYDLLRDAYGGACLLITGDGGYLVKRSMTPPKPMHSLEDLIQMTVTKSVIYDHNQLAGLLRASPTDVAESVQVGFSEYPEPELASKFSHFMIVDRPRRLVTPGQDRTRFHFWMTAPLLDTEFFRTALRVPGRYKDNYQLYTEFLRQLDERSLEIPYANIGAMLGSPKAALIGRIKSIIAPRLKLFRAVKRLGLAKRNKPYHHPEFTAYLLEQSRKSDLVREYFDLGNVEQSLNGGFSANKYHLLATVLTTMILTDKGFPKPEVELAETGFGAKLPA